MTTWLALNIVLWICCYAAYRFSEKSVADSGIAPAVLSVIAGIAGGISSVGYLGAAFWLHRFV